MFRSQRPTVSQVFCVMSKFNPLGLLVKKWVKFKPRLGETLNLFSLSRNSSSFSKVLLKYTPQQPNYVNQKWQLKPWGRGSTPQLPIWGRVRLLGQFGLKKCYGFHKESVDKFFLSCSGICTITSQISGYEIRISKIIMRAMLQLWDFYWPAYVYACLYWLKAQPWKYLLIPPPPPQNTQHPGRDFPDRNFWLWCLKFCCMSDSFGVTCPQRSGEDSWQFITEKGFTRSQ